MSEVLEGTPIDREKLRSLAVIGRRSGARVEEGRDDNGRRWQATTDEANNTVTKRHDTRGEECQDVTIRAPAVRVATTSTEVRSGHQ